MLLNLLRQEIKISFMKIFLFLIVFVISVGGFAQTGIGTTTPVNKFEVVTTTADPLNSGSAANGNLRLGGLSVNHVLDFGLSSTSTFALGANLSSGRIVTLAAIGTARGQALSALALRHY